VSDSLRLRPDPTVASRWSAVAVVLLAMGIWLMVDASFDVGVVTLFGVFVAVASFFLVQLLFPAAFEVVLDDHGIRARTLWQHLDVAWADLDRMAVREFAGDHWLSLDMLEEGPHGWVVVRQGVLLPLGTDVAALYEWLGRRRASVAAVPIDLTRIASGPSR